MRRIVPTALMLLVACIEPNPEHDGLVPNQGDDSSSSSSTESGSGSSGADEGADASQTGGMDTSTITGDGDGDGDADTTAGDGDGDGTTGDGDGTTGDGDGDGFCGLASANLVLCHDFENLANGTFADGSGQGNDIQTTDPTEEDGPWGSSIVAGNSTVYEISDSDSLDLMGAFTFEMRLRPDSAVNTGRRGVIDKDGQYAVFQYPSGIECGSSGIGHATAQIPIGSWTHVACTWDGSQLRLYYDGVEVGNVGASGNLPTGNTQPMALLDSSPGFDEPFDGAMDELRIWNSALTPEQVCAAWGGGGC